MAGLIGRNGAGKTTLMKSIMGLLKQSSGTIAFDGADLLAAKTHARTRLGIGYMPEDRRLIPDLTVEENVLVPAWAAHLADAAARLEKVYRLIPELREFAPRKGSQLSGGQQKLVALGRALMCGTRLLLLDEPFEGVAPALAQRLAEVVARPEARGHVGHCFGIRPAALRAHGRPDHRHRPRRHHRARMRARRRLHCGMRGSAPAGVAPAETGGFPAGDGGALSAAPLIGTPSAARPHSFPASSR